MSFRRCLEIFVAAMLMLLPFVSYGACFKAAIVITSGVKKGRNTIVGLGGIVYRSGLTSTRIVDGSTVAYASGNKDEVIAKAVGPVTDFTVGGDITAAAPKTVTISGTIDFPTATNTTVPARITVSASRIRSKKAARSRNQTLTGFTSVLVTDASSGQVLYRQKAKKFSKLRLFQYQWQAESCFDAKTTTTTGGTTGTVKK